MNYAMIKNCDIADGPGVRVSLFVSGCRNHCRGCFQPETWDFGYGQEFTQETVEELYQMMSKPYIEGLTVLGGDPMEPENILKVTSLCAGVKCRFPEKNVWLYTGYLFENLKDKQIMKSIDVLVDGPFIEEQKNLMLKFRGSENQRLIDVPASLKAGKVVLWEG